MKDSSLAKNIRVFGGKNIFNISNAGIFVEKVEKSEAFQTWKILCIHSMLSLPVC